MQGFSRSSLKFSTAVVLMVVTRLVSQGFPSHCAFLAKKSGQVGGGVQLSSNSSPSVAITFISSQCILGCTKSNVSQKKQTSIRDGRGSYFFHGVGRGKAKNLRGGAGRVPPPLPTVRGGAGKGSKSAGRGGTGAGNILRVLIEIICCSKEISICIALSEVNLLNIHNLDRNHN